MDGDVKQVGTIDCTPTWESVVDLIILGICSEDYASRETYKRELIRMARLADAYIEIIKKQENENS